MSKMKKTTVKTALNYAIILRVRLVSTTKEEVLRKISGFLHIGHKFSLFTPNPEILVEASRDKNYLNILNSSDLNVPDGIGLNFASKFLYGKSLNITPGRKLFWDLIKLSCQNKWKVFLVGGLGNEVTLTKEKLENSFKGLTIKCLKGPKLDSFGKPLNITEEKVEKEVVENINKFNPDILFVGFGAPKQEKWIHNWLPKLNIGGAMAVGGTFSYISGKSSLPPSWMEVTHFEWLWRLLHEPRRVSRILNAVVIFPLKVIVSKFA
jgi:N-acetylglucosaminyldiphosphoundecaprenol N-acetyl-beta-D-mannosaminyltransferase